MKDIDKLVKPDFAWMDTLKGLAIISVVLIHYPGKYSDTLPAYCLFIINNRSLGVELFFILSACLSFFSIEKNGGINSLKEYRDWLLKRFLRLAPLFYFFLICSLFVGGSPYWLGMEKTISIYNFLANVLFVNGFFPHYINSTIGVNWYIADLALFYFVAPVLFHKIKNVKKSILFVFLSIGFSFVFSKVALYFIYRYVMVDVDIWESFISSFCIIAHLPTLALGILLYHIMKTKWLYEYKKWWVLFFIAVGMLILYQVVQVRGVSFYTYHSVIILLFILSLQVGRFSIDRFFIFPALGRYSYGIYLSHFYIIEYIFSFFRKIDSGDPVFLFVLVIILTLILSYLFAVFAERIIEKPVRHLLGRFCFPQSV